MAVGVEAIVHVLFWYTAKSHSNSLCLHLGHLLVKLGMSGLFSALDIPIFLFWSRGTPRGCRTTTGWLREPTWINWRVNASLEL
jgi:hypothetical protein